jgi:NAD(P)-dependent dehydrogenase (short-subunit alcohol dehydrogenase family)
MKRQKELDLAGKVVIITGVSRGMGKLAALNFARRGANLVLAARTVERDASLAGGTIGDTLEEARALGAKAIAVATDLANRDALRNLVDAAVKEFGGVDILVNNAAATAGPMWEKRFLDLSYEDWLYQFDVNVHAPFLLMQMVVPIMEKRGGGRIVNITSGSAEALGLLAEPVKLDSIAGQNLIVPGYHASKRALDRLSNVIASDLAERNVYVVTLYPGWVETERVSQHLKGVPKEAWGGHKPVPMAVPARMMVYFAACEKPQEYTGRVFWAERELAGMDIAVD